jgi:DNA-cytosine methyltransferase
MNKENALSICDGISGGQNAPKRADIPVENYFASEVDKFAISITQKNFPNTIQIGDVRRVESSRLPKIGIILGGTPCQDLSFSGTMSGLICNDLESYLTLRAEYLKTGNEQLYYHNGKFQESILFWEYIRLLKELKPKYFLLENVIMKQTENDLISSTLGEIYPECVKQRQLFKVGRLEPIKINSALVSAQNRERLYWTNIPNVTQPKDKGIILADVIENAICDREKSYCIDANYHKGASVETYLTKSKRQLVMPKKSQTLVATIYKENVKSMLQRKKFGLCVQVGTADIKGNESIKRVYSTEGKSPCLTAMGGGHREPKIICGAMRGRYIVNGKRQDHKMKTEGLTTQRIEIRKDEKTNTLTTVQKDNLVLEKDEWRKLTPLECERLQTFEENYTAQGIDTNQKLVTISNTQRYRCLGNSWTVDVIAHIFQNLKDGANDH